MTAVFSSRAAVLPRRLPWLCGCHDPEVSGHIKPCTWRETGTAQPWVPGWELPS